MRDLSRPGGGAEQAFLRNGLAQETGKAARFLLGKHLVWRTLGDWAALRITEVEGYLPEGDPAAHSRAGRTRRTAPLFGLPGTAYVYLVYGVHHCLNVAAEGEGVPGCVLIRAGVPIVPSAPSARELVGPGRVCRALGIDTRLSGADLVSGGDRVWLRDGAPPGEVETTRRIGISRGTQLRLRFVERGSASGAGRVILAGEEIG